MQIRQFEYEWNKSKLNYWQISKIHPLYVSQRFVCFSLYGNH